MNYNKQQFKFTGRVRSFKHAATGIFAMLKSQQNTWVHAFATILVLLSGMYFGFSRYEWCWIVLAIVSVWTAEAFNTAFEFLADAASPEFHPLIKKSKDIAAGAVLISALGAIIIGLLIIGPYVFGFIGGW